MSFDLLSVADSVHVREQRLALARDAAADPDSMALGYDVGYYWQPGWLPIGDNRGGASLTVDITKSPDLCQVRSIDWIDVPLPVVTDAIVDLIQFCLTALGSGLYQWSDVEPRGWVYDYHAAPIEWRQSGIL